MKFLQELPAWDGAFAAIVIISLIIFSICIIAITFIRKTAQVNYWREKFEESEHKRIKAKHAEQDALAQVELMRAWWREAEEDKVKLIAELAEKRAV